MGWGYWVGGVREERGGRGNKGKLQSYGETYIVPAFTEEPVGRFWVLRPAQFGYGFLVFSGEAVEDLGFGAVDFDVVGSGAAAWVVWVGAADVGDFEDHIVGPVFADKVDADVLHAVSCPPRTMLSR